MTRELAQKAVVLYEKQDRREKRRLLDVVCSNSQWRDGRLLPTYRKPFDLLASTNMTYTKTEAASPMESGFCPIGSLNPLKDRTFRIAFRLTDGEAAYRKKTKPSRRYRNPIILAQEWQKVSEMGDCRSLADLARKLGVSRARVTQVLRLLRLTPEVLQKIVALGDPLPSPVVTERVLRSIVNLPREQQTQWSQKYL